MSATRHADRGPAEISREVSAGGAPPRPGRAGLSGFVDLRSGRWSWHEVESGRSADAGPELLFLRDDAPGSTMRSVARPDPDEADVRRCALDPDERTWMDRLGWTWVIEPDQATRGPDVAERRMGRLRCRDHTPRTPQPVSWPALCSLGALRDDEIDNIVRIAEIRRLTRGLRRIGDGLARRARR